MTQWKERMGDFAHRLIEQRTWLARAAKARLRNMAWAEDAVADTMLAALERRPAFDDPQRLRAWLFGVLRHKVVDQLRRHHIVDADSASADQADADPIDAYDDPREAAERAQFRAALTRALERLPSAQARAFVMREGLGHDTCEISSVLGVTANHVWVMLFRARLALRQGLSAHRI